MRNSKAFLHDLRFGIAANTLKYLFCLIFFFIFNVHFFSSVYAGGQTALKPGAMDGWIYNLKGIGIYDPASGQPFPIPFTWLMVQALMAFLIVSYPTEDLYTHGIQILLRTKNRTVWWLSKCLWAVTTVLLFYALAFLAAWVAAFLFGSFSAAPTEEICRAYSGIELKDAGNIYLLTILLPVLTSMALSLMQMTLSFVLTPLYGYLILIAYILMAAYACSPVFIANFSMTVRAESISPGGFSAAAGVIVTVAVSVLSAVMGLFYFKRCDLLKKH